MKIADCMRCNIKFPNDVNLGFIGVYLAGYILDVTGSWTSVFNVTALINLIGVSVFVAFGSGKPIL